MLFDKDMQGYQDAYQQLMLIQDFYQYEILAKSL